MTPPVPEGAGETDVAVGGAPPAEATIDAPDYSPPEPPALSPAAGTGGEVILAPTAAFQTAAAAQPAPIATASRRRSSGWRWLVLGAVILLVLAAGGTATWLAMRPGVGEVILMGKPGAQPGTGLPAKEFLASDPIYLDVMVKRAQPKNVVAARLVQTGPDAFAKDEVTVGSAGTRFVSLTLAPAHPLTPGRYQLEITLNQKLVVRQDVSISPDPPFQLNQITISDANAGVQADGGKKEVPSSAHTVYASATAKDAPRKAALKATWLRDGTALKSDEVSLEGREEKEVSFTLDGGKLLAPGTYSVQFSLGGKPVISRGFTVFANPEVGTFQPYSYIDWYGRTRMSTSQEVPYRATSVTLLLPIKSAPKGTRLSVEWFFGGTKLFDVDDTLSSDVIDSPWFRSMSSPYYGLGSGNYSAVLRIDGKEVQHVYLHVSGL